MSDILATFAILLAVFTYLESLYHDSISSCLKMVSEAHRRDNKNKYEEVKEVLIKKQIILDIISLLIFTLMLPVSIDIISKSCTLLASGAAKYDISSMSIILLNLSFLGIVIKELFTTKSLVKKMIDLNYRKT